MSGYEKRFEVIFEQKQGATQAFQVVRDNHTGICYLHSRSGSGEAITPLLDAQARPVVEVVPPPSEDD